MRLKYSPQKNWQIDSAECLLDYCILWDHLDHSARSLETVIRFLKDDDPVRAYRELCAIQFFGMGSFTDWGPSQETRTKNKDAEYVSFQKLVDDFLLAMDAMTDEAKLLARK